MKYDDLLNIPFKKFGRDKQGLDCYGLIMECCRRAGTPLDEIQPGLVDLPHTEINNYISMGVNVHEISAPKIGAIVLTNYRDNIHVGYIVERGLVLHATIDKGVKLSPLAAMNPIKYYEVNT